MMALMLFLMLGMSALVIDYGMIKAAKAEAQRAMDAAALAGASAFLDILDPAIDKADRAEARALNMPRSTRSIRVADHRSARSTRGRGLARAEGDGHRTPAAESTLVRQHFRQIMGPCGINAMAAADVYETSKAACVMPVAMPDIWKNNDVRRERKKRPS